MQKKLILFGFSLIFTMHSLAQTVIDAKGTKTAIDPSKWSTSGNDIFNKNTGGVGIGTSGAPNANAALEVRSTNKGVLIPRVALTATNAVAPLSAHVAGMMVYNTATAGTAPNNVSPGFYYNDGTKWVKVNDAAQADNTIDAWIDDPANTQVKLGSQSNGTSARIAGTDVVIKDNGRVGIGTTNPLSKLTVIGATGGTDIGLTLSNNEADNTNKIAYIKSLPYASANPPVLLLSGQTSATNNLLTLGGNSSTHAAPSTIEFWTNADNTLASIGGNKRMEILRDGRVGVGTGTVSSTPLNANAIFETFSTDKGLLLPRLALTSTTSFAPLTAHVAGMTVYNTATAGTAPNDVSPGFYYNDGTKWVKAADASSGDLTRDAWIDDNANTMVKLGTQSDGATARATGAEVVVKDNGRVGIGTPAPQATLHVRNGDFRLENENTWNAYKGVTYSDTRYPQLFLFKASGNTKAAATYPPAANTLGVFRVANAIDSVGGAGFRVSSTQQQSASAHGASMIIFTNKNGESANTDQFIVDQNGNVGIGDMAPVQKLVVQGTNAQPTATASIQTNATLRVNGSTNHNLDMGTYDSAPYGAYIQSHDNTSANGLPLVLNPTGGNVGISTNNPQKKMHVNGALQVTNELNVGGDATTAGSAGTVGQVLTSNGAAAAPVWKSTGTVSGLVAGAYYVQGTTAATATTGGAAIDVPNVTRTIVVPTGQTQTVIFTITGYSVVTGGTTGQGSFTLLQNGTAISSAYASVGTNASFSNLSAGTTLIKAVTLTAGSYTFKVQYKAWGGGTGHVVNNNPAPGGGLVYTGSVAADTEAMLTKMQILVYNN